MAYQLIYTSAARLLDSPASGYGVVAQSMQLPERLVQRLIELSAFKEPADTGINGPQYAYHMEECSGRLWHIFSSVRHAGADYSHRSCHIAHHLILTEAEAQLYASATNSPPSTPAGLILTLEMRRFWLHQWQGEPKYIAPSDFTLPVECSAAEGQPTWHIFSGQPTNARALGLAPYAEGSLILVPQGTQSRDVLRLMHESSALGTHRGWGISFSSYGVDTDELARRFFLFSTPNSGLHQRARRMGFPTLNIHPGMQVEPAQPPPAQAPAPAAAPAEPPLQQPTAAPPRQADTPAAKNAERPAATRRSKQARPPRKQNKALWGVIAAGVLLCVLAALLARPPHAQAPVPPPNTEDTQAALTPTPDLATPAEEPTPAEVPTPAAVQEEPAEPQPPLPDLPPDRDDAQPPPSPTQQTPQPPHDEDEADTPEDDEEHETGLTPPTSAVGTVRALVEGDKLPDFLMQLSPGQERVLETGEYMLHLATYSGGFENRYTQPLRRGSSRLVLRRTGEGEFSITPLRSDAAGASIPTVRLQVAGNKLHRILVRESDTAALRLPIVSDDGELVDLLLLPRISLSFTPSGKEKPKPIAGEELQVTRNMLIRDKKNELHLYNPPASPLLQYCKLHTAEPVLISMPELGYHCRAKMEKTATPTPEYRGTLKTPQLRDRNSYELSVKQRFRPWAGMRKAFAHIVNTPCYGRAAYAKISPTYSIRTLYTLLLKMETEEYSDRFRSQVSAYAQLYCHPMFGSDLRGIFRPAQHLTIKEDQAEKLLNSKNLILDTRDLRNALQPRKERTLLINTLLKAFSQELSRLYNKELEQFTAPENTPSVLYLRLSAAEITPKKQLLLYFELKHP